MVAAVMNVFLYFSAVTAERRGCLSGPTWYRLSEMGFTLYRRQRSTPDNGEAKRCDIDKLTDRR